MLDAAQEAMSFVADRERRDQVTDRMLVLALVKSVEIIGEAGAYGKRLRPPCPQPGAGGTWSSSTLIRELQGQLRR